MSRRTKFWFQAWLIEEKKRPICFFENKKSFNIYSLYQQLRGVPARQYAEKFPKEFFEYMDSDTSLERYNAWVESIGYSGFYDNEEDNNSASIRQGMASNMKQHCKGCNKALLQRIDTLAKNCFP